MPYTPFEDRIKCQADIHECKTYGDLNYLITLVILKAWASHPKYEMIHTLYQECIQEPKQSKFLNHLRTELADRFTVGDIYTAAALAFHEFEARIVRKYEPLKALMNGDLPEYKEAVAALDQEISARLKEREASKIIVPATQIPQEK